MADFVETREALKRSREEKEQARVALSDARERLRKIEAEQVELDRVFNQQNQGQAARRNRLARMRAEAEATIAARAAAYETHKQFELDRFKAFASFTDPRQLIENFHDDFPFLLMPVRIETRFKSVVVERRTQPQLWVRVYPDECAVDSFESTLTENEVKSARIYWADIWRAGGVEGGERSAWRGLVASHGSGRAAWIVENYRPVNADRKPRKDSPEDIILVITTEQPLSDAEERAASTFWRDTWLADGDRLKEELAQRAFEHTLDNAGRVAEIVENYRPINMDASPAAPLEKDDVTAKVAVLTFPPADATHTKAHAWSQAQKVNVMPDRFVLMAYSGGHVALEIMGQPIPSPLVVGPDPSAAPEEQLKQEDGEISFPEDMSWMVDFERAVEAGMGFRINLTEAQASTGFDRLIALGIRLSADERAGKALLEELFQHHRNGRNGLSLVPQGTPTNNTESAGSGIS
jgi:hypothetical protein